jgi:hypothetical protein
MDNTKERDEISFQIQRRIGVLSDANLRGWRREVNIVAWNGREAKLDIRDWSEDHSRMSKGITLTREEAGALAGLLGAYLKG